VVEDSDLTAYDAVGDAPATVDVGALHDYAVLHLGVQNIGTVTDASVRAHIGVGADYTVTTDDCRTTYR